MGIIEIVAWVLAVRWLLGGTGRLPQRTRKWVLTGK
jgi:hypothetical protein